MQGWIWATLLRHLTPLHFDLWLQWLLHPERQLHCGHGHGLVSGASCVAIILILMIVETLKRQQRKGSMKAGTFLLKGFLSLSKPV